MEGMEPGRRHMERWTTGGVHVRSEDLILVVRHLLLVAMHLFLVASCYY